MALLTHTEVGNSKAGKQVQGKVLLSGLCSLMKSWEGSTPNPDQAGKNSLCTERNARGDRRAHL